MPQTPIAIDRAMMPDAASSGEAPTPTSPCSTTEKELAKPTKAASSPAERAGNGGGRIGRASIGERRSERLTRPCPSLASASLAASARRSGCDAGLGVDRGAVVEEAALADPVDAAAIGPEAAFALDERPVARPAVDLEQAVARAGFDPPAFWLADGMPATGTRSPPGPVSQ